MTKKSPEAAQATIAIVELTATELVVHLENIDLALAALQSQREYKEAAYSAGEDRVNAIYKVRQSRSGSLGLLRIKQRATEKDIAQLRALAAAHAGTSSAMATQRSIDELVTEQQALAGQFDAEIADDERAISAEDATIADEETIKAAIEAEWEDLRSQQTVMAEERERLVKELHLAQYREVAAELAAIEDGKRRDEEHIRQSEQNAYAIRTKLAIQLQGDSALLREANAALDLDRRPDDVLSLAIKAQLAFVDALEEAGPSIVGTLVDQRSLAFHLALDQSALAALTAPALSSFERHQGFEGRRMHLRHLLENYRRSPGPQGRYTNR